MIFGSSGMDIDIANKFIFQYRLNEKNHANPIMAGQIRFFFKILCENHKCVEFGFGDFWTLLWKQRKLLFYLLNVIFANVIKMFAYFP